MDRKFDYFFRNPTINKQTNIIKKWDNGTKDTSFDRLFHQNNANKENVFRKQVFPQVDTSLTINKTNQAHQLEDMSKRSVSPILIKQRSTTHNNNDLSFNLQLFRDILQPQKNNNGGDKYFSKLTAVQDSYFQQKPLKTKTLNTAVEDQMNFSSHLKMPKQENKAFTITKKCETERGTSTQSKMLNQINQMDDQDSPKCDFNTTKHQQMFKQKYQAQKDKFQNQENTKQENKPIDQPKFFITRSFRGLNETKNQFWKQSAKQISNLSNNNLDQIQNNVNATPKENNNNTSLGGFLGDKITSRNLNNILLQQRTLIKQGSNNTLFNYEKEEIKFEVIQKQQNETTKLFHPMTKKHSSNIGSIQKLENNKSDIFTQKGGVQKGSISCSSIQKKLRAITFHNQTNSPLVTPKQKVLIQSKAVTEEYKFQIQMSVFPVEIDDFQFMKDLGHGSYALVRSAMHKKTSFQVAIKSYDKKKLQDPYKKQNVEREVKILQNLYHKHIIKLYKVVESQSSINLIMEYQKCYPLNLYLKEKPIRRLHEQEAKLIFRQIAEAVQYLHRKRVIHRDIKLENILINQDRNVKLIDFGFSIVVQPSFKLNMFCGTPSYMAPEIINKEGYSFAVDLWALGILLYKLLTGLFPFTGKDDKCLFKNINDCQIDYPMYLSPSAKNLLQSILKKDPQERKILDKILKDEWL